MNISLMIYHHCACVCKLTDACDAAVEPLSCRAALLLCSKYCFKILWASADASHPSAVRGQSHGAAEDTAQAITGRTPFLDHHALFRSVLRSYIQLPFCGSSGNDSRVSLRMAPDGKRLCRSMDLSTSPIADESPATFLPASIVT